MYFLISNKVKLVLLTVLASAVVFGCRSESKPDPAVQFVEQLPHAEPQEITHFQSADTIYFEHLGYRSIPLEDGSFLLYDRGNPNILQLDRQGNLVKQVAREGRGPGEVRDIISLHETADGEILVYDQESDKGILYNRQLEFAGEIPLEPYKGLSTTGVFAPDGKQYLVEFNSLDYLRDETKQPEQYLVQYNSREKQYGHSVQLQARDYARFSIDGRVRGASAVPFANVQMIEQVPGHNSLYLYWSGSGTIAEVDSDFDTLRTIPVEIPSQQVSDAEIDTIRSNENPDQWKTMKELLPEFKSPANRMLTGADGQLWLELNYRGPTKQWLIIDREGAPQKIVHLPDDVMLTHVSSHHLGVRVNSYTFALYERVE